MKKYYLLLLAALVLLTSCSPEPEMPMSHVPSGIIFLAIVGVAAIIICLFGFILVFGDFLRGTQEE